MFVILVAFSMQFASAPYIYAAPARCFNVSTDSNGKIVYTEFTCPSGDGYVGGGFQDDQCYSSDYDVMQCPQASDVTDPTNPPPSSSIEETGDISTGENNGPLDEWLNKIINTLTALTGLVIVISLIIAGIQYMTARDNASQVAAAKNRIVMSILAFVLYLLGAAFLQWLVPGGVF